MSETTDTPQPGVSETAPEPQPQPTEAPADDTARDTIEGDEQPEPKPSRADRRFAELTAKLDALSRENARREEELAHWRRQAAQVPPADETPEQREYRVREQIRDEERFRLQVERFHAEGASQYGDWAKLCEDVKQMGADAPLSRLIVEMPEAVKVVAALADDPAAVQRISNIQSERGRAIALGKFAATIEDRPAIPRAAPVAVTRAPAPVRTVTGRTSPTVNPYTMTGQEAVDYFMRQDMERQQRR
jgi:hypothetical protein